MDYPIWDVAMGGSMLIAIVAITHVIVSHFAIGGGLLIAVTETLAVRRGDRDLRELVRRSSLVLILVSTVFGAISGVGIWVVVGLIAPATLSTLIHTYVWGWAIEWVFFIVEIVAALVYYATWGKISKAAHVMVAWVYFVAAYLSLVIINGILTFMLTPGRWLETGEFWDGFFNPTYFPALVQRTGIALMMAIAFMALVALRSSWESRPAHMRYLGWWMVAGVLVTYAGYRWWEAALPDAIRATFLGPAPFLPQLAATRSLTLWALLVCLVLAAVLLVAAPRLARGLAVVVLAAVAFTSFAAYERLREGVRKPYLIRDHMFSNGLRVDQIEEVNRRGLAASSGWVARAADGDPAVFGAAVFRAQCSSCHTLDGYQGIREPLPTVADAVAVAADTPPGSGEAAYRAQCSSCHADVSWADMRDMLPAADELEADPAFMRDLNQGMILATILKLRDQGETVAAAERRSAVDPTGLPYPVMPPFVGTDEEAEALAAYLSSLETADSASADRGGA